MKYNWRWFLARCFRFVTYRVKRNTDIIRTSSCVFVSHWFTEKNVKNYRNYLSVIFTYVQCITVRMSWCDNTQLQTIHSITIQSRTIQLHLSADSYHYKSKLSPVIKNLLFQQCINVTRWWFYILFYNEIIWYKFK
jgi:hypothetical protein